MEEWTKEIEIRRSESAQDDRFHESEIVASVM